MIPHSLFSLYHNKISIKNLFFSLFISLLLFITGFWLSILISVLQYRKEINLLRERITVEMNTISNNITREIYSTLNLTQGISALVKIKGNISCEEFNYLSAELLRNNRIIRNTVLAPDNIIKYVYPLEGNEKVKGVNYENLPDQIESVRLATKERKTVIAGPVNLVQGGVGIIVRTPIFVSTQDKKDKTKDTLYYWGIAGTVIYFDSLINVSGLKAGNKTLRIALRGVDGSGVKGKVFWGDSNIFSKNPVLLDIVLPYGSWHMAAIPLQGWKSFSFLNSFSFWAGTGLSFVLSFLLFTIFYINQIRAAEITKRKAAEEADRLKSAFLATMSHELRTPLNSIIGFTSIILQGLVGDINEEQKKQLTIVKESSEHLLALINDILDISKIEAGQLELKKEYFTVKDALDKILKMVSPMIEKKGLSLALQLINCPEKAYGDKRRFEQVLINILTNAIKFTERGEIKVSVNISVTESDRSNNNQQKKMIISVKDSGIGLRKEDIKKLFIPFQQVDSGTSRKYDGTGLGLFISKKLANMMGGDVNVYSEGIGSGSTFTFSLPLKGDE